MSNYTKPNLEHEDDCINFVYIGTKASSMVMEYMMKTTFNCDAVFLQFDVAKAIEESIKRLRKAFINFVIIDAEQVNDESVAYLGEISDEAVTLVFVVGNDLDEAKKSKIMHRTRCFFWDLFEGFEASISSSISCIIEGFDGSAWLGLDRKDLEENITKSHNEIRYIKGNENDIDSLVRNVKECCFRLMPKGKRSNILLYFSGEISALNLFVFCEEVYNQRKANEAEFFWCVRSKMDGPSGLIIISY